MDPGTIRVALASALLSVLTTIPLSFSLAPSFFSLIPIAATADGLSVSCGKTARHAHENASNADITKITERVIITGNVELSGEDGNGCGDGVDEGRGVGEGEEEEEDEEEGKSDGAGEVDSADEDENEDDGDGPAPLAADEEGVVTRGVGETDGYGGGRDGDEDGDAKNEDGVGDIDREEALKQAIMVSPPASLVDPVGHGKSFPPGR